MHKAGWIHQNLNPENLYLCIDPATGSKGGVIGGFELTKHIGTEEGDNEPLVCPYCPIKSNVYINVRLGRPKIYGS